MGNVERLKTNWKGSVHARGNAADRSPESVAMVLRNARILMGYDIDEVAHALNIRTAHLEALEDGDFAALPPLVYAQGFVAAYASFLQLDRAELVSRFRDEANGAPAPLPTIPQFNLNTEPDSAERRMPSVAVIIAGFVLVAFAYGLWQSSMPDQRDAILAVPPLPSRFAEEAVAPPVVASAPTEIYAQPVNTAPDVYQGAGVISFRAYGDSWIQFRNPQGQRIASLTMRAGQTYTVPASWGQLVIETGSLSALAIMVDGRLTQQKAAAPRTRYELTLDPTRLLGGSAVLN